MDFLDFLQTDNSLFDWVILPLLIFFARIIDQSIGTMRVIVMSKGYKKLAPFLAFFEVLIWITVIGQIIQNMSNPICYVAYALGFATGNYVGMIIEERISLGNVIIRIIPEYHSQELVNYLRSQHYVTSVIDGEGSRGEIKIVFAVIPRQDIRSVIPKINELNPSAFYTIEDVKAVKEGVFVDASKKFFNPFTLLLRSKR